jgi:twitching motility protein PilI
MMTRRVSLREFQEGLAARLTQAHQSPPAQGFLGVESGGQHWLISLSESGEVIPLPPLAPVPLTKPWFVGMANVRGALYGVIDFSAFCGGVPTVQNLDARLLLVGAASSVNAHCALLVSRTLGLKNPSELTVMEPIVHVPAWSAQRRADTQGQSWRLLHVSGLLEDPVFLSVGL